MARDESAALVQVSPAPLPQDPAQLPMFLEGELARIWTAVSVLAAGHMAKTHVAPEKPRDGDIRYADGTDWDPGTGEGAYIYYNATWNKMG